jgi:hypothetical protein
LRLLSLAYFIICFRRPRLHTPYSSHRAKIASLKEGIDTLPEPLAPSERWWLVAALVVILYAGLAAGMVRAQTLFVDEGYFAPAAWSLLHAGHTGSLTLEECVYPLRRTQWLQLPGIHQRSYWHMPGYFLMQTGWYRIFGFGLLSMRALSALTGAIWMLAAGYVMWRLTADEWVALATAALLCLDMAVLRWESIGRMDLPCAALWMSGCAAYLALRERRPGLALAASHTLVACAGLTHPIGGLAGWLALVWLQFRYRPPRIGWRELATVLMPYILLGALWLSYVLEAPRDWSNQFGSNSSGRMAAWSHPWRIFSEEFFLRLLPVYGLRDSGAWFSRVKLVTPLLFALVFVACLWRREWRRHPLVATLLLWAVLQAGTLAALDAVRSQSYLVHALFAPVALTAWFLLRPGRWRMGGVAVLLLLIGLYTLNAVRVIAQNSRAHLYDPMVVLARRNIPPSATVTGPSELAFTFGFDGRLRDDFWLGYCSGRKADYLVVSADYEDAWRSRDYPAEAANYVDQEFRHYRLIGSAGAYKLYRREP